MPRRKRPVLGVDYIMDGNGRAQFTEEYLKQRGTCCEHDCRFCPYPNHTSGAVAAAKNIYTHLTARVALPLLTCGDKG
jgi:hypothetical protein